MPKKLLITLPCNVGQLQSALEKFDKYDVVVTQYYGEADSLYCILVEEDEVKVQ